MNLERKGKIIGCVAVIALLTCCGIAGYLNKKQQGGGEFSGIRIPAVQESDKNQFAVQIPMEQEDDRDLSAVQVPMEREDGKASEDGRVTEKKELSNIKSAVVFENETHVVLDENGQVWQWQEGETKNDAPKRTDLSETGV